jgi:hypothetical protein
LQIVNSSIDWKVSHLNLPDEIWAVRALLRSIELRSVQKYPDPGWLSPFLWRELLKHKADVLGEEIAMIGCAFVYNDLEAARRLMDLYEDGEAHPYTRGNALFALKSAPIPPDQKGRLQRTIRNALNNTDNPYARCTGCMLAEIDPTIKPEDLEHLLEDEAGIKEGWGPKVKHYAATSIDSIRQYTCIK